MLRTSLLYRIASGLLALFAVGHTVGFREIDPGWGVDSLVASMQTNTFRCSGVQLDVLGFLCGIRAFRERLPAVFGRLMVTARGVEPRNVAADILGSAGTVDPVSQRYIFELEVLLRLAGCFLRVDWAVSDGCGLVRRFAAIGG